MTDLVTIEEARAHLRIDDVDTNGGPDDPWLTLMITAISQGIRYWLKDEWRPYVLELDSDGEIVLDSQDVPVWVLDSDLDPVILPVVKAACLIELDRQYRFRDGGDGATDVDPSGGYGFALGRGATALLIPLRKPTLG